MKNQISTLGAAALALVTFGGGYLFGYVSGRSNTEEKNWSDTDEKSWSDNCEALGEFYLCDDLRGFGLEAVDIQYVAMGIIKTEVREGLERKKGYSLSYGAYLAVRRNTKEPFLVAACELDDNKTVVVGSIPIAKVSEKIKAMKERDCPENLAECDWDKMYSVSVYEEAVEWAQKIVAQVPDKKE